MPAMDGTGPLGTGPIGRGLGPCGGGRDGRFRGRGFFGRCFGWGMGRLYPPQATTKEVLELRKTWLEKQLATINQWLQESEEKKDL